jgi:hypothetical protein
MTLKQWLRGYPEDFQRDGFYNPWGTHLKYEDDKPYFSLAFVRIFCIIGTVAPVTAMVYLFWS